MEQFTTLSEVRHFLDSIPYINNGGCAYSALAMYSWLQQRGLEKDYKIIYAHCMFSYSSLRHNRAYLDKKVDHAEGCSHAYLYHIPTKTYIDSGDSVTRTPQTQFMDVDRALIISSLKDSNWNSSFNRDYVPMIEQTLQVNLKSETNIYLIMTKNNIKEHCSKNNIAAPKFSGKTKTVHVSSVNDDNKRVLSSMAKEMNYKLQVN